jgi:hypothetical protein
VLKHTLPLAVLALSAGSAFAAESFVFTVDPGASSLTITPNVSVALAGTLIGDYDATTNPNGTQTRPGLFGGSGNQPIPLSLSIGVTDAASSSATGSVRIDWDSASGLATIWALDLDLTKGGAIATPIELGFEYDTFRSIRPNSLYPGNIPIRLPIGEAAISALRVTQIGDLIPGVATTDENGLVTITAIVPVTLDFAASALGNDFALPEPVPAILPLRAVITPGASPTLSISFEFGAEQELPPEIIEQIPPIENQPLALPTLLPPGQTANVLLNVAVGSAVLGAAVTGEINAGGVAHCGGDFDNNGVVEISDYEAFIDAFEAGLPRADFNQDFFIDYFDLNDFVDTFKNGCQS